MTTLQTFQSEIGAVGKRYWNALVAKISAVKEVTADYQVLVTDRTVIAETETGSADLDITLPAASSVSGDDITIISKAGNTYDVNIIGTINGVSDFTLSYEEECITVTSNGTNYIITKW